MNIWGLTTEKVNQSDLFYYLLYQTMQKIHIISPGAIMWEQRN